MYFFFPENSKNNSVQFQPAGKRSESKMLIVSSETHCSYEAPALCLASLWFPNNLLTNNHVSQEKT